MIRQSLSHMINVIVGLAKEGGHMVIIKDVKDHIPFSTRPDQTVIAQEAQLMRDCRLRDPRENRQVADAQWLLDEGVQDARTSHICQGLERFDHELKMLLRKGCRLRCGNGLRMNRDQFRCFCHRFLDTII